MKPYAPVSGQEALGRARMLSEALNHINEVVHSTPDAAEVMEQLVRQGAAALGCDAAAASMRENGAWEVLYALGMPEGGAGSVMTDIEERHALLALDTGAPVAVEDAFEDERFDREHLRAHGVRSVLVVPLIAGAERLGVLFFNYRRDPHLFTEDELSFSRHLATVASLALKSARHSEARKRSEEQLARQRELLQRLFDELPVLLVMWDPRVKKFKLNRRAEAVLGWSNAEANDGDFMTRVYPDPDHRAEVIEYMQSLEPGFRELSTTTRDGREVPIEWANVRLSDETMVGIGVDLTRHKEAERALRASEERYRSLFDSMTEGFALCEIVCDESGQPVDFGFLEVNPGFTRLTGLERDAVVGRRVTEVISDIEPRWIEVYGKVALGSGPVRFDDYLGPLDRHYEVFAFSPAPGQFAALFLDITLRKLLEKERQQHAARIEREIEIKDTFLNTLSHELRTPLGAMANAVELLRNPAVAEGRRQQIVGVLERNVSHQTRLVDELLDLSRIMRKKVKLELEPLDLRGLIESQLEAFEPAAQKSGLALSSSVPEQPVWVRGDGVRLAQVIGNLLTNAIKFTEAGGRLDVELGSEGDEAVVSVKDTGIGISCELLPQIFETFKQGDSFPGGASRGLGIGLSLARSLAELHQGTLVAHSEGVGCGSEFVLRLPLTTTRDEPAESRTTTRAEPGEGLRILVVEDSADLRDTLTMLLELLGHSVVAAASGADGIDAVQRENPDVAVVDIGLPDMDGYEVARRLREDGIGTKPRLIALTGYAGREHRDRALRAGFDAHLSKPVEFEDLRRALSPAH